MLTILLALIARLCAPAPEPQLPQAASLPVAPNQAWHLTLPAAIRAKLDQPELVRSVMIGAQPIPVGDFVPTANSPLANVPDRPIAVP